MASFNQAVLWMLQGKKTRRVGWNSNKKLFFKFNILCYEEFGQENPVAIKECDVVSNDWEIYEERFCLSECLVVGSSDMNKIDGVGSSESMWNSHYENKFMKVEDIRKAIRKIKDDLLIEREILIKKIPGYYYDPNPEVWTNAIDGIDSAIKKIDKFFGEKLI